MSADMITTGLFDAIDIIISGRLKELKYDRTEICTIVDASNAKNGEYRVSNGSVIYTAKSENDTYQKDDQVRVSYINGDATQEKFIVGKYVGEDSNLPITYLDPLDSVMQMSGNLFTNNNSAYGLITNGETKYSLLGGTTITMNEGQQNLVTTKIYDTLSVQAEFKTLLNGYNIVSGNYGLLIRIGQSTKNNSGKLEFLSKIDYILDSSQMLGDPYAFGIYTKQAAKFDISNLGIINSIQVYFYQQGNFEHNTHSLNPVKIDCSQLQNNNLLVKNIMIGFGCDVTKVADDTLKLFTLNNDEYDNTMTEDKLKKTLTFTWYNKNDNGQYIGFSDGATNKDYADKEDIKIVKINDTPIKFIDEKSYTNKSAENNRRLAQVDYNIPMDTNGLDAAANLKEAYQLLTKANNLITQDVVQTLQKFNRYCDLEALETAYAENIKPTIGTGQQSQIDEMYKEYVFGLNAAAAKYNTVPSTISNDWKFIVTEIPNQLQLTPYVDDFQTYKSNIKKAFFGDSNIFLESLLKSIISTYSGYKGIYDTYSIKIQKLLAEADSYFNKAIEYIKSVKNTIEAYWNANYSFKQWQEADFSEYENGYCVYWYQADKFAAGDEYMPKGWQRIDEKEYARHESLDVTLRTDQDKEQYKVILFFNHVKYESNILTFDNLTDLEDQRASLSDYIEIAHGNNSKESYQSYSEANTLLNSADAYVARELVVSFVDVDAVIESEPIVEEVSPAAETEEEQDFILKGAQIYWYIPMDATMLKYDLNDLHKLSLHGTTANDFSFDGGTKVDSEKKKSIHQKVGYYGFYKTIQSENDLKFSYRIKNYYLQSASQNTIKCKVVKGDFTYESEISMMFSSYGNSGTDYSISIIPHSSQAAITPSNTEAIVNTEDNTIEQPANPFRLDITLYDSQNNELEIPEGATVSVVQPTLTYAVTDIMKDENTNQYYCDLYYNKTDNKYICGILQVTIPNVRHTAEGNENKIDLTAFYPIPYSAGVEYYIEGATTVVYDSQGGSPTYYKDPYKIFAQSIGDGNDQVPEGKWQMVYTHGSTDNIYPFMPTLTAANKLKPCTMWIDGGDTDTNGEVTTKYYSCVQYVTEDTIIWSQPILLIQNRYESPMLNAWDGSFQIDEENGTILSTMVGAGRKNKRNQFEGVLMGDIGGSAGIATGNHTGLGIYGFHEGQQSFGFNIDGTAFIGKSKAGRIVFNGNSGTIKSASYDNSDAAGTNIDVDEGIIHLRGLKGLLEDYPDKQAEVYLSPGHQKYDNDGKPLDVYDDYFRIKSVKGNDLIRIGKDEYFLKTDNFNDTSQGVKLDLADGKLIGYNFSLQALGENDSGVIIDSSGDPYLQITDNKGNTLLKASKTEFFLKSASGNIDFDLANSSLTATEFTLNAISKIGADGPRNGIYLSSYGTPNSSPYLQVINNDKKLLYIDSNDFYLQDKDETLKLDLNDGSLIAKTFTLDAINDGTGIYFSNEGSTNQPFLKIVSRYDDDDKTLLYIDKDSFYLQSHDWVDTEDKKAGTQINLMPGENQSTLKSYNFNLTAYHIIDEENTNTIIIDSSHKNSPFNINNKLKINWDGSLNVNDKFKVDAEGNVNVNDKCFIHNDGSIDINYVPYDKNDPDSKQVPTLHIDPKGEIGINYCWIDYADLTQNVYPLLLLSNDGSIRMGARADVKWNDYEYPFLLSSNGELACKTGNIGGWTFNGRELESHNLSLSMGDAPEQWTELPNEGGLKTYDNRYDPKSGYSQVLTFNLNKLGDVHTYEPLIAHGYACFTSDLNKTVSSIKSSYYPLLIETEGVVKENLYFESPDHIGYAIIKPLTDKWYENEKTRIAIKDDKIVPAYEDSVWISFDRFYFRTEEANQTSEMYRGLFIGGPQVRLLGNNIYIGHTRSEQISASDAGGTFSRFSQDSKIYLWGQSCNINTSNISIGGGGSDIILQSSAVTGYFDKWNIFSSAYQNSKYWDEGDGLPNGWYETEGEDKNKYGNKAKQTSLKVYMVMLIYRTLWEIGLLSKYPHYDYIAHWSVADTIDNWPILPPRL